MHCCPLCPYQARFAAWLRKHTTTVHERNHRPFVCDVCQASFTSLSNLNHHRQIHGARQFACTMCDFTCTLKRVLDVHVRIHSDERPFKCDLCEYRTKRKSDLPIHCKCMHSKHAPRKKKREEDVALMFDSLSITYRREFMISFQRCARKYARLDFLIDVPFGWIILEVDERQHFQYQVSSECQRMALIFSEFSRRCQGSLHIIRFNPDAYKGKDGRVIKSTQEERTEAIRKAIDHVPQAQFMITYLFYRSSDGWPEITSHPDYTLRQHVRRQCL